MYILSLFFYLVNMLH